MNALLPFTKQMLQRYGEFYPHGGYMDADEKITLVGAQDPDTDHPKSKDLIYILRESLRQACTRGCRAAAIAFDVTLGQANSRRKGDAIQICIEHVDGYSVEVFFPYQIVDGQVVYGETFAQAGKHEIFT
jgi:hypothetical protein